jgi:DNA-binding MarR family transcriptional regulator
LEKVAALQSLVYLYEQKEATRTDLRNNIDAALKTIYSALPVLVQSQLIEEKISNKFPFTVTIHLTEKGRKVAWHLAEIVKILKE